MEIKGTISPGFCSFFVITVLIIQLVTLFHAQNVLFTAKGRYQVNFRIDTKLLLVLSDLSKTFFLIPNNIFTYSVPETYCLSYIGSHEAYSS